MLLAEKLKSSIEDYLQGELSGDIKHEYVNGDIYAMAGASEEHNTITVNLIALLHNHLRGTDCKVFASDMKTHIQTAYGDFFYYPDIQVCCQKDDKQRYYKEAPKLIIEVLSNSTQRHDRCEKFNNYRQLDSLEEYVLIAQDKRQVEIYRRAEQWQALLAAENDAVRLESLGLTLNLADIYEGVALSANREMP